MDSTLFDLDEGRLVKNANCLQLFFRKTTFYFKKANMLQILKSTREGRNHGREKNKITGFS